MAATLLLFAERPTHAAALRQAVPADQAATMVEEWAELARGAPHAACAAVVAPWLADAAARRWLGALATDRPHLPLVLVTTKDADNARLLARVRVAEVVWLHELATSAWPAIRRARAASPFERALAFIATAAAVDLAAAALLHAWNADPPIRSVAELARAVHCDRRTLWRHWQASALAARGLRLEDVLDWVLLLRAALRKDDAKSWGLVAAELGVHEHTLHRWARRLAGRTLGRFAPDDDQSLVRQFATCVVHPMLGAEAEDILR